MTITHRGYQLWDSPTHKSLDLLISWWKLHGHKNRLEHLLNYYEAMGDKRAVEELKKAQAMKAMLKTQAILPPTGLPGYHQPQYGYGGGGFLAPPVVPMPPRF